MFESLGERLTGIFDGLKKRGALKETDVEAALREVRVALLEADVALPVVKDFIASVKEKAVGQEVIRSVSPGQMVVKIVNDALVEMLSPDDPGEQAGLIIDGNPPVVYLMVGLQGSGKTTTSAKIALRLKERHKKKVMLASLDVYRPAAQKQLQVLGGQADVSVLTPMMGEQPVAITNRAVKAAKTGGYDALILDTAGRLAIDQRMMSEVVSVRMAAAPRETLLVADAMTGQDAVNVAREFNEKVGLSGIVLTRVDGDARGGAALSMRQVTGKPLKLIGTGEKMDALDAFDARRVAGAILGMGDVVGLVEKAQAQVGEEEAQQLAKKMMRGQFTLNDMAQQFKQIKKMGGLDSLLGMLPGARNVKQRMAAHNVDGKMIAHQEAIILSMTSKERQNPKLINGSRRKRIAAGSGTTVSDVNKVLKQHRQMADMMKKVGKQGGKGLAGLMGGITPPLNFPR